MHKKRATEKEVAWKKIMTYIFTDCRYINLFKFLPAVVFVLADIVGTIATVSNY